MLLLMSTVILGDAVAVAAANITDANTAAAVNTRNTSTITRNTRITTSITGTHTITIKTRIGIARAAAAASLESKRRGM